VVEVNAKYLIYALVDPRTSKIRYIGKSCQGLERPNSHLRPFAYNHSRLKHIPVYCWIRKLVAYNLKPKIEILLVCESKQEVATNEKRIISEHRLTCRLLNVTDGGDGGTVKGMYRPKPLTSEQRIKRGKTTVYRSDGRIYASKVLAAEDTKVNNSSIEWAINTGRAICNFKFSLDGKFETKTKIKHNRRVLRSDGVIFNNLTEAAKAIDTNKSTLRSALIQCNNRHKGLVYTFLED